MDVPNMPFAKVLRRDEPSSHSRIGALPELNRLLVAEPDNIGSVSRKAGSTEHKAPRYIFTFAQSINSLPIHQALYIGFTQDLKAVSTWTNG